MKKAGLAVGSALVFVGLMELTGWVAGVEPAFHREDPYAGFSRHVPHYVRVGETNGTDLLGVAPNKAKVLNPQTFTAVKAPGTYRIVCVGGSSTYGRPFFDGTSYAGWLRAMLRAAEPGRSWEVINAGAISYASYRDVRLMEELAAYGPDLFVVYTGHNEFLERRTYAGWEGRSGWVAGAVSVASRTRTATMVRGLMDRVGVDRERGAHRSPELGEETRAIPVNAVGPEAYHRDERFSEEVAGHFRATLNRMVDVAEEVGAAIVFVGPASNLADFIPFKSEHREGLGERELALWNRHFMEAQEKAGAGRWEEARGEIEAAAAIDDRFAALWYWKGRIARGLGDGAGAYAAFVRARDEDVCPLRAIGVLGEAVREVARSRGVPWVDFEEVVVRNSEDGLPGRGMFHDHVHLTVEANRQMGLALVERLRGMGVVRGGGEWGDAAIERVTAEVLAGVDRVRHAKELRLLSTMLGWLNQAEMARHQADLSLEMSGETEEAYGELVNGWRGNGAPGLAVEYGRRAVAVHGGSAALWTALGTALLDAGDSREGIEALRRSIGLRPDDANARTRLGVALALRGEDEEAAVHFGEAVRLRPDSGTVRGNYGLVLARMGKLREAVVEYEKAVEIEPSAAGHRFQLGQLHEQLGDVEEAVRHYRMVVRVQPEHPKARERLTALEGASRERL